MAEEIKEFLSQEENETSAMKNLLPGKAMRVAMETKGLLKAKGQLYAGTGLKNTVTIEKNDGNEIYEIPITKAVDSPIDDKIKVLTYTGNGETGIEWKEINDSTENGTITEEKLSSEVQDKLNKSTGVEGNPLEEATEQLDKLKINDTIYEIPSAEMIFTTESLPNAVKIKSFWANNQAFSFGGDGVGTNIEANPETEATTDLTKITIEDITYSIPSTEISFTDEDKPDALALKGFNLGGQNFKFVGENSIDNSKLTENVKAAYASGYNLLDNGDFEINQKGATEISDGYNGPDRWRGIYLSNGGIINSDGTISLNGRSDRNCYYAQYLPTGRLVEGEYYTLSTEVDGVIYSASGQFLNRSGYTDFAKITFPNGCALQAQEAVEGNSNIRVQFLIARNTNIANIKWAQLEPGTVATPHKRGNKTLELLRCQSRFLRYKASITYMKFGYGNTISNSTADIFIPFNNNMDNTLTVVPNGNFNIYMADGTAIFVPVTDMVLRSVSPCGIVLRVTTSSTALAVNAMCYLQSTATTDYIDFDCQL